MKILQKLLRWLPVNLAGLAGVLQAVVKAIKEILTVVVNILFPIIPSSKFKKVVMVVRNLVNRLDAAIEKAKSFFLGAVA